MARVPDNIDMALHNLERAVADDRARHQYSQDPRAGAHQHTGLSAVRSPRSAALAVDRIGQSYANSPSRRQTTSPYRGAYSSPNNNSGSNLRPMSPSGRLLSDAEIFAAARRAQDPHRYTTDYQQQQPAYASSPYGQQQYQSPQQIYRQPSPVRQATNNALDRLTIERNMLELQKAALARAAQPSATVRALGPASSGVRSVSPSDTLQVGPRSATDFRSTSPIIDATPPHARRSGSPSRIGLTSPPDNSAINVPSLYAPLNAHSQSTGSYASMMRTAGGSPPREYNTTAAGASGSAWAPRNGNNSPIRSRSLSPGGGGRPLSPREKTLAEDGAALRKMYLVETIRRQEAEDRFKILEEALVTMPRLGQKPTPSFGGPGQPVPKPRSITNTNPAANTRPVVSPQPQPGATWTPQPAAAGNLGANTQGNTNVANANMAGGANTMGGSATAGGTSNTVNRPPAGGGNTNTNTNTGNTNTTVPAAPAAPAQNTNTNTSGNRSGSPGSNQQQQPAANTGNRTGGTNQQQQQPAANQPAANQPAASPSGGNQTANRWANYANR